MSTSTHDRGMRAVERVRSVRERDSRLGLQQATAERDRQQARLDALEQQLHDSSAWTSGETWSYLALRGSLLGLGESIARAEQEVAAAQRIAESAAAHWGQDRTRLAAVENLLARRAEARRTERARREARELDDISAQLWTRQQGAAR
ncbi:flagellar FliJ family protein [Nocardioides campestrisoli]|uniref:flagellar FliJ family protein n=1 Tax=Nocardioides campestrisoli TaxID=2736757 RepID=UPI0015E77BCA|nr:flagellar FliJ family protein [Nocardioides campestrisoli]